MLGLDGGSAEGRQRLRSGCREGVLCLLSLAVECSLLKTMSQEEHKADELENGAVLALVKGCVAGP